MTSLLWLTLLLSAGSSATAAADCEPQGDMEFICGLNEPEDLVGIPGTDWVLASDLARNRQPGDVYLIDRNERSVVPLRLAAEAAQRPAPEFDCPSPPDPASFTAHGVTTGELDDGSLRFYVVNHGGREAVEAYEISLAGDLPAFTWIGCVVMPEGADANSVASLPDGGILVTSLFNTYDKTLPEKVERVGRGEPSGAIWEWYPGRGFRTIPLFGLSGANGIDTSADGKTIFVNGYAESAVYRLNRFGNPAPRRLPVDFRPDNLHRTPDGKILAAGHRTVAAEGFACLQAADRPKYCLREWGAVLVDPETMEIERQWSGDGNGAFGDVTAAIDAGDSLLLGSLSGDRIAVLDK